MGKCVFFASQDDGCQQKNPHRTAEENGQEGRPKRTVKEIRQGVQP